VVQAIWTTSVCDHFGTRLLWFEPLWYIVYWHIPLRYSGGSMPIIVSYCYVLSWFIVYSKWDGINAVLMLYTWVHECHHRLCACTNGILIVAVRSWRSDSLQMACDALAMQPTLLAIVKSKPITLMQTNAVTDYSITLLYTSTSTFDMNQLLIISNCSAIMQTSNAASPIHCVPSKSKRLLIAICLSLRESIGGYIRWWGGCNCHRKVSLLGCITHSQSALNTFCFTYYASHSNGPLPHDKLHAAFSQTFQIFLLAFSIMYQNGKKMYQSRPPLCPEVP